MRSTTRAGSRWLAITLVSPLLAVIISSSPAAAAGAPGFNPITPARAVDTRATSALNPLETRRVVIAGIGGVPSAATSVALNVTVVSPFTAGYLTVFPSGTPRPNASNINFVDKQLIANTVITGLGTGAVDVYNGSDGPVHVLVDVAGWYESGFTPITPTRIMDTRSGLGGPVLNAAAPRILAVRGVAGVPAAAIAVAFNITATQPSNASYLTVWPTGAPRPLASNLNMVAGYTVANAVMSGLGSDGSISLANGQGTTHLIVDVAGWFTSGYHPVTPARVMDTRSGQCLTRLGPKQTRLVQIAGLAGVPAQAGAVVLNVTAVNPTETTYLSVWPSGQNQPLASNLNPITGIVPNMVTVGLGTDGRVALYNQAGTVDVIIDVNGWYDGTGTVGTASACDALGAVPVAAPVAQSAPPTLEPVSAVSFGARSENVSALQRRLLAVGYWVADDDGSYGQVTSQAVMAFQKYNGLPASGNLDVYAAFLLSMQSYKPLAASRTGDLLEVDKGKQLVHFIRQGKTVLTVNTSTGSDIAYVEENQRDGGEIVGDAHTPVGRFRVNRVYTDGWEKGQLGELYRPRYFNGGIALHGAPAIPNYPASHGCVRVTTTFMDYVWDAELLPVNSSVWVHD